MDEPTMQLLLTDALLIDAAEGLDAIAAQLVEVYDRWSAMSATPEDAAVLAAVLTDLGWWSGRLQGAISAQTIEALERVSGGS